MSSAAPAPVPGDEATSAVGPPELPAVPIHFGPRERPLFGFYHPPRGAMARGVGAVLCSPFGQEQVGAYRACRCLAERLAREGFAVLRFDHDGTGDSAGSDEDAGRVPAWIEGVEAACVELRRRGGMSEVVLAGIRLGATLAVVAAAERAGASVGALVLWSPLATGSEYVREMAQLRRLRRGPRVQGARPPGARDVAAVDGAVESSTDADTPLRTPATADALRRLDLLALGARPAARALVLARDRSLPEAALVDRLRALGVEVTHEHAPGFARMLVEPHRSEVPERAIDRIAGWLQEAYPLARPPEAHAASAPSTLAHASAARPGAIPPPAAHAASPLLAATVDGAVRETPLSFGPGGRLFGILSEPREARGASGLPAVLLLNAGAVHHIGPHRAHVLLARRWAALGFAVLRLDLSGLGDSPAAPGCEENLIYPRDAVADVRAALDAVGASTGAERFVLAGLCSGAYVAFLAAVADRRVEGAMMINGPAFQVDEGGRLRAEKVAFEEAVHYRRAARDWASWRRLLGDRAGFGRVVGALGARATRLGRDWLARARPAPAPLSPAAGPVAGFEGLLARGAALLFLYADGDAGLDHFERYLRAPLRRANGGERLRVEIVEGADHTFTAGDAQRRLAAALTHHLTALHGLRAGRGGPHR